MSPSLGNSIDLHTLMSVPNTSNPSRCFFASSAVEYFMFICTKCIYRRGWGKRFFMFTFNWKRSTQISLETTYDNKDVVIYDKNNSYVIYWQSYWQSTLLIFNFPFKSIHLSRKSLTINGMFRANIPISTPMKVHLHWFKLLPWRR